MKKLFIAACLILFSANLFAQSPRLYLKDGVSLENSNKVEVYGVSEYPGCIYLRFERLYLHKESSLKDLDKLRYDRSGTRASYDASLSNSSYDVYTYVYEYEPGVFYIETPDFGRHYVAISKDKKTRIDWREGKENQRTYYRLVSRYDLEKVCRPKQMNTYFLNE